MKRYYPWVMCTMAMLVLIVSNGMTMTGLTAFDESLLNEFGWSRGALKFRDMLNLVLAGLMSPFIGALIDRAGVRTLILFGNLLLAALYLAYSQIHSITHVYLIHVGFAAVVVASGMNVAVILVSQWFEVRRGTALGIALAGSSLGGMLVPKLITGLLPHMDWRESFMWMSAIPLILFVLCLLLVRSPAQAGLSPLRAAQPDLDAGAGTQRRAAVQWPDLSYRQALRTPTFWALTVIAATSFYSIMSLSTHLMLHMRDLGFAPDKAANGMFVLFGMGMVGKFLFGILSDFLNPKRVFISNLVLMFIGTLMLASQRPELLWYSLLTVGLGWGGLYAVLQLQIVGAFGLSSAGKILGTITLVDAITAGMGIWLTAVMFDYFGSYVIAFNVLVVLVFAGLVCSFVVREERKVAYEKALPPAPPRPATP